MLFFLDFGGVNFSVVILSSVARSSCTENKNYRMKTFYPIPVALLLVVFWVGITGLIPTGISFMMEVTEEATLTSSNNNSFGRFGWSVDISGEYAIAGAPNYSVDAIKDGAAYIFEQQMDGTWLQQAALDASDGGDNQDFGHSVAIDGDYAIVGAYEFSVMPNTDTTGKAYIYNRDINGVWTEETTLTAPFPKNNDWFGWSVGLAGDYAIVGALFREVGTSTNAGKAYIFFNNGTNWVFQDSLEASDAVADDNFGFAVDIRDNYAVVSAKKWNNGSQFGKAYVFERNGTQWNETDIYTSQGLSGVQNSDQFGTSVAINAGYVAVGAPTHDTDGNSNQGKVYVFDRATDLVSAELTGSSSVAADGFGIDVALSDNNFLAVGAYHHATGGDADRGKVYAYQYAGAWTELTDAFIASDGQVGDLLGNSVGITENGAMAIAGAWPADVGMVDNQGKAYVFEVIPPPVTACAVMPAGAEQAVAAESGQNEGSPAIAHDANGNYVICWIRSTGEIIGQAYDWHGQKRGMPFQVNSVIQSTNLDLEVAMDAAGNFAVIWNTQFNANTGVYVRRFNNSCIPQGPEFLVNTNPGSGLFEDVGISMADDGSFVAAWSEPYSGAQFVAAQRYNSDGTPLGGEIVVSTGAQCLSLDVDLNNSRDFNIIWYDFSTGVTSIRRYNADGTAKDVNPIVASNSALVNGESPVGLALYEDGSFTAAFGSVHQHYDAGGALLTTGFFGAGLRAEDIEKGPNNTFAISYTGATKIFDSDGIDANAEELVGASGNLALRDDGGLIAVYERTDNSDRNIYLRRFICPDTDEVIPIACGYEEELLDDFSPNNLEDYTACSIVAPTNERVYRFTVSEPTDVFADFTGGAIGNILLLSDYDATSCLAAGTPLVSNALPAGTYYIVLERDFTFGSGTFSFFCKPADQDILYVDIDAKGNNDGTSWPDAYSELQLAINAANLFTGTDVWVAEGTYNPTRATNGLPNPANPREHTFFFDADFTIYGGFAGTAGTEEDLSSQDWEMYPTILDGNIGDPAIDTDNSYHVVTTESLSEAFLLDGFIIRKGYADFGTGVNGRGAGWYNIGATYPQIRNCVIRDHFARNRGGALHHDPPTTSSSVMRIENTEFLQNFVSAANGVIGGHTLYNNNGKIDFIQCSFLNGAGRECFRINGDQGTEVNFRNCRIESNFSFQTASLINCSGQSVTSFINCLITRNDATQASFMYVFADAEVNFVNTTFTRNSTTAGIPGAYFYITSTVQANIDNCIFWDNINFAAMSPSQQIAINHSIMEFNWTGSGTNNLNTDPLFVDVPGRDFRLQPASPAIDFADNAANTESEDLDSNPRIVNDVIDAGAYEVDCINNTNCVQIAVQTLMQGPYNGSMMNDGLRSAGLIEMTEPFTGLGYTHVNGGGGEAIDLNLYPDLLGVPEDPGDAIVDWVFLSLRVQMPNQTFMTAATRSALLQRDGDIVDVDGVSAVVFANLADGDYFVEVRHRNHLGVMTALARSLN